VDFVVFAASFTFFGGRYLMQVAILGATKGMGRALARLMIGRGDRLFLLGRDTEDLGRSARDLEVRGQQPHGAVGIAHCDLEEPATFEAALESSKAHLGRIDVIIVTAGVFATQEQLEQDTERARKLLVLNLAHTIAFAEHARKLLLQQGGGTLCVFSSVAGDRGRKPVAIYGASKAGLSYYLEALDHKFRAQGLKVVCVKPGFVKTSMTAELKTPPFAGEPDEVARTVLKAIEKGTPVVYAPPIWRYIMLVIRSLPRMMMRRLAF